MKDLTSLEKSATARINQIIRWSKRLHETAVRQKESFTIQDMADMRNLAQAIDQATHEYSAYQNAIRTD